MYSKAERKTRPKGHESYLHNNENKSRFTYSVKNRAKRKKRTGIYDIYTKIK